MVKSTINDWIVCQPNDGSIVEERTGSISCENIKSVAQACSGVVPEYLQWKVESGPTLRSTKGSLSSYYRFEGARDRQRPIHDPCGTGNASNHKKEVANPGGQIYLR